MADRHTQARSLAAAFLAGAWTEDAMVRRARAALVPGPRRLRDLVRAVRAAYREPPADRPRELAAFVEARLAAIRGAPQATVERRRFLPEAAMGRERWPVPPIATVAGLAAFLELGDDELLWLADARAWERWTGPGPLRNYRYAWVARPDAPVRLLEQPKARLKAAQRRVLHGILDWIPAHPAAHGFVRGRSVRTHAAAHACAPVVLRFDLEDFFVSIAAGRVHGVLRSAGYPEAVAHALTALCTNSVARGAWAQIPEPRDRSLVAAHRLLGRRLAAPHLPQGAPTSPMLANLCAFALDRRLSGLAARLGATYTRYADDLTFSGDRRLIRDAPAIERTVGAIAADEGLRLNARKTRAMPRSGRQRVTGVVVNAHPNVARDEFDRLKATLHNAARDGLAAQNRAGVPDFRAHLEGRIAWVASLNPARGARLRRILEAIPPG